MHRRFARALSGAACLIASACHAGPEATLIGRLTLALPQEVGGLSGIELDAQGSEAFLLSDRGWLFKADIARDADARPMGVTIRDTLRLRHTGETRHPDSEGVAGLADGTFLISTENPTRLLMYRWGHRDPDYAPEIPTQRDLEDNRGLEALALEPGGAAVALFETPDGAGYPVYRFENGAWSRGPSVPATVDFSVVGADFDSAGRLYILERAFSLLGFRTQVRRVDLRTDPVGTEMVLQTRLGEFDNLEGIAVSRTPEGETRITLISDDNFLHILRTELVEFHIKD